jgi:molecular chaperone DnaK
VNGIGPPYALGVDLGTTYTAAALWHGRRAEVLRLARTGSAVPSVVLVEDDGRTVAGPAAEERAAAEPERVARAFKRRFGDDVGLLVAGQEVAADALTADVLRWVLATATARCGGAPTAVVITVPATWQGYRLELMQQVAQCAGVPVDALALVPEPAAAAIYYAGREQVPPGTRVAVYDFGGGTFDATVMQKTGGGFEILGLPRGDEAVGGIDIDFSLLRLVARSAGPAWSALDRGDPDLRLRLARLSRDVVVAKEQLTLSPSVVVPVDLPGLPAGIEVTRAELEHECAGLLDTTVAVMRDVIAAAGLEPADLDRVLLVGGSSRMPMVRRVVAEQLQVAVVADTHPKYAVCLGAAITAGTLLPAAPAALPVAAPTTATATVVEVNLSDAGLTEASHVPVRPAAQLRRRGPAAPNEPLIVSLGHPDAARSPGARGAAVAVALAVVAILAAFTWLMLR